jgi:hypothetical protein
MQHFQKKMMGYSHIQATRPQTLAYDTMENPEFLAGDVRAFFRGLRRR